MDHLEKLVMLIDADNTQLSKMEAVIREVSAYGRISVKRAYGNWSKIALRHWEFELKRLAIKAEQQFDYVTGKNATDIALVIGALDLLHTGIYDAFVLVASDSDYTPLAIRLRESGVYVIGVGGKMTPISFRKACDEFIYLENLAASEAPEAPSYENVHIQEETHTEEPMADIEEIHNLLEIASEKYQDGDGFVNVSAAGEYIKRTKPDFDCRTFGYIKLPDLLSDFPKRYEMKRYPGKGTVTIVAYKCLRS